MRVLNGQVIIVLCITKLVKKVALYFPFNCITFQFLGILDNVVYGCDHVLVWRWKMAWLSWHDLTNYFTRVLKNLEGWIYYMDTWSCGMIMVRYHEWKWLYGLLIRHWVIFWFGFRKKHIAVMGWFCSWNTAHLSNIQ